MFYLNWFEMVSLIDHRTNDLVGWWLSCVPASAESICFALLIVLLCSLALDWTYYLNVGAPVWVRHVHFEIFPNLACGLSCGFTSNKIIQAHIYIYIYLYTYLDTFRVLASDQSRNAEWRCVSHPNCSAKFGRGEQHAWICQGTPVFSGVVNSGGVFGEI